MGLVDVDDCCTGARFLAARGVWTEALAIRVERRVTPPWLPRLPKVFAAGATTTESATARFSPGYAQVRVRYLDTLIAVSGATRPLHARSPLHHFDGLDRPLFSSRA